MTDILLAIIAGLIFGQICLYLLVNDESGSPVLVGGFLVGLIATVAGAAVFFGLAWGGQWLAATFFNWVP